MAHPFFDVSIPTVIGHRGCGGELPENTLASFALALERGAAILETDVHLTRDGVPVLLHDDAVDRVSDGSGRVVELSLAQLQRLDAAYCFTSDGGLTHPERGRGHRIPSLEEAFAAFPRARFNLELKEDVPGIVERSVDLIRRAGREALTLITAADDALMARLRADLVARPEPPIAQGASAGDVLDFIRTACDGTAPGPGPMALQIPEKAFGRPLATRQLIEHAHAHGVFVHVWTINEPAEMRRLLDLGVDGIVTDFPGRLARVVDEWCA